MTDFSFEKHSAEFIFKFVIIKHNTHKRNIQSNAFSLFDICPCSATTNFKQWDFWNSEIFTEHRRSILNLENY